MPYVFLVSSMTFSTCEPAGTERSNEELLVVAIFSVKRMLRILAVFRSGDPVSFER